MLNLFNTFLNRLRAIVKMMMMCLNNIMFFIYDANIEILFYNYQMKNGKRYFNLNSFKKKL